MSQEPLTLVVGQGAFLARSLAEAPGRPPCRFVGHRDLDAHGVFSGVTRIVNFALDPRWRREDCPPDECLDLRLARVAADRGLSYVLMSSRKVYHPDHQWDAGEDAPTGPTDAYGRNKLAAEERLRPLLGDHLLVLRVANVFGYERGGQRRTFMAAALGSLAGRGEIVLDVDPGVRRDFLPDPEFGRLLAAALRRDLRGTFNLGSGQAVPLGQLTGWIMDAFGAGRLLVTDHRRFDSFRLDTGRLRHALAGEWAPKVTVEAHCRAIGRRLAAEAAGQKPHE
ncbi:NAD-dependent epimerase/dehydratase family protein [Arenibaculum pallidiluteum]|uniref:NAD-dependent epimerase/dehydratase family protein n=1 Tax=Arenibaculum pallidiluteum TaxID=2812559 RepID=UPI001A974111|nr:NAD(P)-dependent oxidoreductase [Arenibaculum pallidiluteum]